jgi:D-alanyl-D-alanine carboxypeptidase/D-alanyl-D-alanine-endopeptidase (penicillin-binding protein 4)
MSAVSPPKDRLPMRFPTLQRSLVAATTLTLATMAASGPMGTAMADEAAAAPGDAALVAALDQTFANPVLAGSVTSMQVLDGATGAVVYSRGADQRVVPASNQKLLTSAAALAYLGADFRFHTTASYSGTKSGRTVKGSLFLKGTGDPSLTDARIDTIAKKVAALGVTSFTGDLVADTSAFDRTPLGLDWSWEDETYAFSAPISALTAASTDLYDAGSVAVAVKPGASGKAGVISLSPRNSYVTVQNNTVTGAAGSTPTVAVTRRHGTNTVVVTGSIPLKGATTTKLVSVEDPALLAASAFRDALKRHKVTVTGKTVVKATSGTVKKIYDLTSIPLGQLMVRFLKVSNNGHAELLIKAMGATASGNTGTWANGLAQARTTLAGLGVSTSVVTLGDGSGLSRRDLLTTRQLAGLLNAAQARPWFTTWYNALPIAGAPGELVGGTLAGRFVGTKAANNLHGKSGTMTGVNALSGFVNDTTGRRLVFSVVSNNATSQVSGILDEAAVKLANSGSAAALSARVVIPAVPRAVTPEGEDVECSWVQAC